jgi:hypothetical protein
LVASSRRALFIKIIRIQMDIPIRKLSLLVVYLFLIYFLRRFRIIRVRRSEVVEDMAICVLEILSYFEKKSSRGRNLT